MLAIAKARPTNLAKLADTDFIANALLATKTKITLPPKIADGDAKEEESKDSTSDENAEPKVVAASAKLAEADVQVDFISQMTSSFWKMYKQRPFSPVIAPVAPEGWY